MSGTGASTPESGAPGGGRSGPSKPPMLGTFGSEVRMLSTSSSDVMMNCTNAQIDQCYFPNTSERLIRPAPVGW